MEITLTTPALLFPAISLLLLAYTNRFLTLASLIRDLHETYKSQHHETYKSHHNDIIIGQLRNLRTRVTLIRNMQALGVTSLFLCVFCMFLLFAGKVLLGEIVFGISLILLMASLALSIREIQISVNALNLHLSDMEHLKGE